MGKLVRLELFNFKSYKGHHTLLFGDSYFTSIIGPNGSGKSNSMDAISFVLGIKSSHLRSAHLRDLVYRGRVLKTSKINDDGSAAAPDAEGDEEGSNDESQSQKPGRNDPKSAWVMAVYEDDAGDEQKWKRSISNKGASEYRINERTVTAVQYNEALESENILIKARNFLVFQGDVEAIASQSPKDLTRLIEQISGSLDYKAEYEKLQVESELAQENQGHNLTRRRGLNSEIKQYQEQKKEAEAYQNKANEKDDAIVTHILWKLYHFQRVIDESSASIQGHQENLKEYRRGVKKYDSALKEATTAQTTAHKNVAKAERAIKKKEKEIETKENDLIPIDTKISVEAKRLAGTHKKCDLLIKQRDDAATVVENSKKELAKVEKDEKRFEEKWKETIKKQGKELSEADYKEYNTLKSQVVAKTAKNQAKLDHLTRQLKTDEVTLSSLKGRVEASEAAIEKLEAEVKFLEERQDATKAVVKDITKEIDSKKKEFNSFQSERVRVNQLYTEKDEKLQEVLKRLDEAQAGLRQSFKEKRAKEIVVSLKRLYPGVRGRVGELCKPKQKKFEEAVVIALGRDFDSVIVDTEKTGTDCVQYLKEQRYSPMTFIPLDNIKVSNVDSSLKSLPKARLTIDTINFDPSLERAMAYACGSSIICDDLPTAKNICYAKKIEVKAITVEGHVIHKAGLMTGGRIAEQKNKRKFEDEDIPRLEAQVAKLREEIDALPKVNRKGAAEETLQSDLTGLTERLNHAKSELVAFEKNLASKKKELSHEERQLDEMGPRYDEKKESVDTISENVREFKEAIAKDQDNIFSDFCKRLGYADIRAYEAQQGSLEQEAAETRNSFETQKQRLKGHLRWATGEYQNFVTRVENLESQIVNQERDIENYEAEKMALEDQIQANRDEETVLQDELHKQKEKLAARNEAVNKARAEYQKQAKEVESRTKAIAALKADVERDSQGRYALLRRCKLEQIAIPLVDGSKSLDSLPDDNIPQIDPDAMEVDEEDGGADSVNDYGIEIDFDEFDDDLKNPDDNDTEELLLQRIKDVADELEKLNPNMRAIDRLEGVESRLKATDKEYEDARTAAKKSKDAFNEVKEKRFDLFNKAFQHISEQISHVYKDLTRSATFPLGGQAYLDIEDSDTPYLSGIKYHAMPPLKRFRDMEHLSGGEKTMAALALLFAVHSYQPSPFFVLDEVDAALDNANVEKIKNYIRDHAGPGMQFIVISLKTGLFQGSESLVGVFRDQEANSSKTLTLDLRKYV